jgi:hypothetical protein
MLGNIPFIITEEDEFDLMKPINEEDILKSIWELEPHIAARPGNFSISFYKSYWSFINIDIKLIFQYVQKEDKVGSNKEF